MLLIISLLIAAEFNYQAATQDAINSEGSDADIENAYHARGFEIEAMDPEEPSMFLKVKALFNN